MSEIPSALLDQSRSLLEAHPVRGVSPDALVRVLTAAQIKRMNDQEHLCAEGDPGDAMYFLLDGAIRVTRTDPQGKMRELAVVQSPAIVGHMALIDHSPRSANCTARGRTVVASLNRKTWSQMLHEPSRRGMALRRILCASLTRQLVGANARIRTLLGKNTPKAAPEPQARRSAPQAPPSRDLGHHTGAPPRAAQPSVDRVEEFDASDSELMRLAGVLDGWSIDRSSLRQADEATFVFDEDQQRNRKNN